MVPHLRLTITFLLCVPFTSTLLRLAPPSAAAEDPERIERIEPFRLPTTDEQLVELDAPTDAAFTVICFLGSECPLARLYAPRLNQLAKEFSSHQIRFLAINSNRQDSLQDARAYAEQHELQFPLAKDFDNIVADRCGATRTPEVFVVDRQLRIRYQGRIDDQYVPGISRNKPEQEELRQALEALVAGQSVERPRTEPVGCLIGKVKSADPVHPTTKEEGVTYCRQVVRVLRRHCVECHRPGEIGPFALTDYEEVVGWSEMMLEVIEQGRMPPWNANPKYGHFANARHMPDEDKQLLQRWVAAGHPYGTTEDLPEPEDHLEEGRSEQPPEQVFAMRDRPFIVPATGTVEYQYFVVDPGFTEDKWIRAAEVVPGNRQVVHHCIVFIRPPDGASMRGVGWLTGYVPGSRFKPLPDGYARRVPAGSKLVFQMHYTPTGTEQSDLTRMAVSFADPQAVTHEVITLLGINQQFEIPPHAARHAVRGRLSRLPKHSKLLSIMPHMHLRGKNFRLEAVRGEEREILLDVPQYDFNWQHNYELQDALPLAAVDSLEFTAVFDNSQQNPSNPDPTQYVTWGDQTWEEMAVVFIAVSRPLSPPVSSQSAAAERAVSDSNDLARDPDTDTMDRRVQKFVAKTLRRWDANGDGVIQRQEAPLSIRTFAFRQFDLDRDGVATKRELQEAAARRLRRTDSDRGGE